MKTFCESKLCWVREEGERNYVCVREREERETCGDCLTLRLGTRTLFSAVNFRWVLCLWTSP